MSERRSAGDGGDGRSALERVLGVVTEVRAGEGPTALLLTLNVFLLLTAYYFIKPVREGLILAMESGAEYKSYLGGVTALALLAVVPLYGRVADRVAKPTLVQGVTAFFASHLLVFYLLSKTSFAGELGLVFFVWVGIFNMMPVAQFWAFANDLYTEEEGKRLFPLVGIGASVGAVAGSWLASTLVKAIGTFQLMLVSAALLVVSALLTRVTAQRGAAHPASHDRAAASRRPRPHPHAREQGTFAIVVKHKYLLLIAAFSVLFTFVNTNGEYMLSVLVRADAAAKASGAGADAERLRQDLGTAFYGSFYLWVNVGVFVLQTFLVSRIVKFGGLRLAFFILPAIALFDAAAVAVMPVLGILRIGKVAENATDYSVNNTVRNMLWLPTTTEMKYKAKQAVDTFFVRMGDVASALIVALGKQLHWSVRSFALLNLLLVVVWLAVARGIVRENARLSTPADP